MGDKTAAEYSADRENTNAELSAVLEYYSKIKDRCIARPEAYADRQDRRAAETRPQESFVHLGGRDSSLAAQAPRQFPWYTGRHVSLVGRRLPRLQCSDGRGL